MALAAASGSSWAQLLELATPQSELSAGLPEQDLP